MIPYRYAGFLFANRATFPKFVIKRESRRYYSDRFELDQDKFLIGKLDEINIDKIVSNLIVLLFLLRQVQ